MPILVVAGRDRLDFDALLADGVEARKEPRIALGTEPLSAHAAFL